MITRKRQSLSTSLVRNTWYNLLAQGIQITLAIWAIPILIRGIGEGGFGLLSLMWVVVGYFGFLDFGLSRATTRFLSEARAKGDATEMRNIVWASLSSTFVLGAVGGCVAVACSHVMVDHVFNIEGSMRSEAVHFFTLAGIGIPFMTVSGTIKGFQMALERFDIANLFQVLSGVSQWIGSVVLIRMGYGLPEVILLTIGSRIILCIAAFAVLPFIIPDAFSTFGTRHWETFKKLLSFGGWVTLSQVISPLFVYIDRILVGMFLSLSSVAYYAIPQEALTRVLVFPMSLTAALFPAMSQQSVLPVEENKSGALYDRSVKYLVTIVVPIFVIAFLFAPEVMTVWLGKEFALHSISVFKILLVGLMFNSLAQVPATMLHAFGRPDLTAKFHAVELPIAVALNVMLIPWLGIEGAAIVWSLRVILDTALLFIATEKEFRRVPGSGVFSSNLGSYGLWIGAALVVAVSFSFNGILVKGIVAFTFIACCAALTWMRQFDDADRKFFLSLPRRLIGS